MTEEEIAQMREELKKQNQEFGRWSWLAVIEKLAKGDITKFDSVCEQNFISCLNLLAYWLERDKKIEQMEKEQRKQINQIR